MKQYIDKKYKPIKGGTGSGGLKKAKKPPTNIRIPKPPKVMKKRAR